MRTFFPIRWHYGDDALYDAILSISSRFGDVCLLDSNHYNGYPHSNFGSLMALGSLASIECQENNAPELLQKFCIDQHDWVFGYLSYDLKDQCEPRLKSRHSSKHSWSLLHFFVPQYLLMFHDGYWQIGVHEEKDAEVFLSLLEEFKPIVKQHGNHPITLQARTSKANYIQSVESIKKHIHRGDIFEMNYCLEYFAEAAVIKPEQVYHKLDSLSHAPFGAFLKLNSSNYLLCSSPERYLKKQKNLLITQPIKGTRKRSGDSTTDNLLKEELYQDSKERSENVMIVDLVRNDLSRICEPGTVKTEELFGIYSFRQVHQMISTVIGEITPDKGLADIIHATFPMGSMTGAPKVRAMELIDQFEDQSRGLYSGAVGYITPSGNFDFNVVIRSIIYDAKTKYLSAMVGSAITEDCDAEKEYEECLLKLKALQEALQ